MEKTYKTGLVLSGGGARGFAHLGVIQALNEFKIFPDVISGTSAGAIAGVLYADGYTPAEIMSILNSTSRLHYMRPTYPKEGLFRISGIIRILKEHLRAKTFSEQFCPLESASPDIGRYGRPLPPVFSRPYHKAL